MDLYTILWGLGVALVIYIGIKIMWKREKYWREHPQEWAKEKERRKQREYERKQNRIRRKEEERAWKRRLEEERRLAYQRETGRLKAGEDWKEEKAWRKYVDSGGLSRAFRKSLDPRF